MPRDHKAPKSERLRRGHAAYLRKTRLLREENGLCSTCGKCAPRPGFKTCQDCAGRIRSKALDRRKRVAAKSRRERKAMVEKYGEPVAIWQDNGSRDGVKMARVVNPLRALRAIDLWLREC